MSSNNSGIVLQCVATYVANAPIATIVAATMQTSPVVLPVTELQVPLTENWIATDVYILVAGAIAPTAAVNPIISMDKNRGRQLVQTPPLSSMLINVVIIIIIIIMV